MQAPVPGTLRSIAELIPNGQNFNRAATNAVIASSNIVDLNDAQAANGNGNALGSQAAGNPGNSSASLESDSVEPDRPVNSDYAAADQ